MDINISFKFVIPAICIVLILGFIFFQIGSKALSISSGWEKLSAKYGHNEPLDGQRFTKESALMNNQMSYNGVLTFIVNSTGLGIENSSVFKRNHPPLFIPWADIKIRKEKVFFRKFITLVMSLETEYYIRISENLATTIKVEIEDVWEKFEYPNLS